MQYNYDLFDEAFLILLKRKESEFCILRMLCFQTGCAFLECYASRRVGLGLGWNSLTGSLLSAAEGAEDSVLLKFMNTFTFI